MKNLLTYIFALFVIILVSYAVYFVYKENQNKNNESIIGEGEKIVALSDIRLGIVSLDTLNPILSKNKHYQDISKLVFNSLLTISEEYKIENLLAEEWSVVNDTSYIVKLRNDIKWHDSMPLVAADVKFTIDTLKRADIDSIYKDNVRNIVSTEIIDEHTLKINLDGKVPFFEYNLIFPILANHYYLNEDFVQTERNNKPLGTGTYKISIRESNAITLVTEETSSIKTINISLYNSIGELYNAFKVSNIDVMATTNINWKQYIGTFGFSYKEIPGREYEYLSLNCSDSVLNNPEVRKAIGLAVDKTNIVSNIFNNEYIVSNFPLDYGSWLYPNDTVGLEHNIEQAKQTLLDGGWTYKYDYWQKDGLIIDLNLVVRNSDLVRVEVAEIIKQDLEKAGIKITIDRVTDYIYQSYLNDKDYDIIFAGRNLSFNPDLTSYFSEGNLANYNNEEAKSIVRDLVGVTDEKILKEKYKRLVEIYNEEVPYISLYNNKNTFLYSKMLVADVNPNWYNLFNNISNWYRQKK